MKISWSKALADYLKDETESYASIARKHDVSLQAVKKRAGKEGWVDLRQKSLQKVNQELPELVGEDLARVSARQAQIGKVLQGLGLRAIIEEKLEPKSFNEAVSSIKDGAKIEREAVEAGAEERKKAELSNIFNKTRLEHGCDDELKEIKKLESQVSLIQKPVQVVSNSPVLTPELLAKIQKKLKDIQEQVDNL